jgi:hypothetical protein
MLSGRLIHLIEDHQEQIATNVIREIRQHPDLVVLRKLSDAELRERAQQILKDLGYWLSASHEAEIERSYEILGKARFEEAIPLDESLRGLAIIKNKMIDFVHYQGIAWTAVDLYAEEELERRIGRFFDELAVHMVRGYETAWHRAAHAVA